MKRVRPGLAGLVILLSLACEQDPVVLGDSVLDLNGCSGREAESFYLEMEDGVRIALDVYLPVGCPGGSEYPTILELTRYWRDRGDGAPYNVRRAVQRGFAYVVVDERGTGASFGSWPVPLTDRALEDVEAILDWIVGQPWSNGLAGATGVSYPGMAAQRLATIGHPALRAIVPKSDSYDLYGDLIFPGGLFNEAFLQGWGDLVWEMDRNTSLDVGGDMFYLAPVDDDPGGDLLSQAVAQHATNLDVFGAIDGLLFRDQPFRPGLTLDDISTFTLHDDLPATEVAVYHWGSWMDAGSADGVIRQFMASAGPERAVVGAWSHDLGSNTDPFLSRSSAPSPRYEAQWEETLNFFEDVLRKGKPLQDRILRYYTMGENLWKAADTWPIPGTQTLRLYLREDGLLSPSGPTEETGEDLYTVNFEVRSSTDSRWLGPLYADAWYSGRLSRDLELQVYETEPLEEDIEVTGYPVVNLEVASTATDGAFFVYLEDHSPQHQVRYVTEGMLRGMHRRVGTDPSPWARPTPYHSFRSQDAQPMVPGEVTELTFGMQPTSVLFQAGHRIRIAIAGHDAASFRRVPAEGTPELRIQRNSLHPSWIELPVIPR